MLTGEVLDFLKNSSSPEFSIYFQPSTCPQAEVRYWGLLKYGLRKGDEIFDPKRHELLIGRRIKMTVKCPIPWFEKDEELTTKLWIKNPNPVLLFREKIDTDIGAKNALLLISQVLFVAQIDENDVYIRRPICPEWQSILKSVAGL